MNFFVFQLFLNYLDNYLPDKWNFKDECTACAEDRISLDSLKVCLPCVEALKAS